MGSANSIKHRINAGKVAVENEVAFFHAQLGQVKSEWKEDDTRVTFADFAISEKVFCDLRKSFPGDQFCSEESNPADEVMELEGRYTWVLDPVDGTNNYALGLPVCGISLALLIDGVPAYGFVYDALRRTLVHGGPGHGLWEGRERAGARAAPLDRHSIVGMHFPLEAGRLGQLHDLLTTYRLRSLGSGALNLTYVAVGILDGCIDFKVKVWDIAAAHALLAAAGGEFHFIGGPGFPLESFHVDAPVTPFFAGGPTFCRYVAGLLGGGAAAVENPIPGAAAPGAGAGAVHG